MRCVCGRTMLSIMCGTSQGGWMRATGAYSQSGRRRPSFALVITLPHELANLRTLLTVCDIGLEGRLTVGALDEQFSLAQRSEQQASGVGASTSRSVAGWAVEVEGHHHAVRKISRPGSRSVVAMMRSMLSLWYRPQLSHTVQRTQPSLGVWLMP